MDRAVAKSDTRKGRASDRKVRSSQGEIEAGLGTCAQRYRGGLRENPLSAA